jgi:hypothetical protein
MVFTTGSVLSLRMSVVSHADCSLTTWRGALAGSGTRFSSRSRISRIAWGSN